MITVREIKAKSTLAKALVKNIVTRPFRRSGARGWLDRLAQDNLTPTAADTWDRLAGTSRCIACGLCDVLPEGGQSPSATLMAASRRPEDAVLVQEEAQLLRAHAAEIARICPVGVPAQEVAKLIEENAAALSAATRSGQTRP